MSESFVIGEVIVAVISLSLLMNSVPLLKEMMVPPLPKKLRAMMAKLLLPMIASVLFVGLTLDRLKIPTRSIFSSAMFVMYLCCLVPLYLAVFREKRYGYLKLFILGIGWAIFLICVAISVHGFGP